MSMKNIMIKLPTEMIEKYKNSIEDLEKKAKEFADAVNNFNTQSKYVKLKINANAKFVKVMDQKSICNDCIYKDDEFIGCKFNKKKYNKISMCGKYIEVDK